MKNDFTLNCKGRSLILWQPIVMGILNATPDSFYNQGKDSSTDALLDTAKKMVNDGATILDIGGMSTKAGSDEVSIEEELNRVIPLIQNIKQLYPDTFISIDTFRSQVAATAVEAGADIVNDISAGSFDKMMYSTVASLNTPFIAMHIQGTPKTMQANPHYDDVVVEVLDYFIEKIQRMQDAGIKDIIIDPGFGFGKTIKHNYELLKSLHTFQILDKPILVGLSRKSMIYKLLDNTPNEALNGTSVLHTLAVQQGAQIIRTHDVKEAMETIKLCTYYNQI